MSVNTIHPKYLDKAATWEKMRDAFDGEEVVKRKGQKYLPPTKGMLLDGMEPNGLGLETYNAYKTRAVFPSHVQDAVDTFAGAMWQKDPNIELPPELEHMRERATVQGESLHMLLRNMNEEQLISGRAGLLVDVSLDPETGKPQPYFCLYSAEDILNWDSGQIDNGIDSLNLVVLNESGLKRNGFEWTEHKKYRVLILGDLNDNEPKGVYRQEIYEESNDPLLGNDPVAVETITPQIRGVTLDKIPFRFVNTKDITPDPDRPPLQSLADLSFTIYRGEADYRQNLFMQGQDTLVVIGEVMKKKTDQPLRVGAGAMIQVEQGGDARFIGVNSQGLVEQRAALKADYERAGQRSGKLMGGTVNYESGAALKIRNAAQTATLNSIARTAAGALEQLLKLCARWVGADPDKVKVEPNLEFGDYEITGNDLVGYMNAKRLGAPLSQRSLHGMLNQKGMTQMTYEDELKEIESEPDLGSPDLAVSMGTQPKLPTGAKSGNKWPTSDND